MGDYPWFRVYSEILSDRKLQRIRRMTGLRRIEVRGAWLTLLAMANDSPERGCLFWAVGVPITEEDIADDLELDVDTTHKLIESFATMGMLHTEHGALTCTNWGYRQYESDSSTERVKAYRARRKSQGLPSNANYDRERILERDQHQCVYCAGTNNLCVDHVVPLQQGGTDDTDNLVCACKKCNSGKAGRTPEEAGYTFFNARAELRYRNYLKRVTVTETAGNGYCNAPDTETETETKTETEQTVPASRTETAVRHQKSQTAAPTQHDLDHPDPAFVDQWQKVLDDLRQCVPKGIYESAYCPLVPIRCDNSTALLACDEINVIKLHEDLIAGWLK